MGGYGALLLGSRAAQFCAVGAPVAGAVAQCRRNGAGRLRRRAGLRAERRLRAPAAASALDRPRCERSVPRRRGRLCTAGRRARSRQAGRPRRRVVERVHAEVPTLLRACLRLSRSRRSSCTSTSRARCGRTRCSRSRSGTTTRCPTTSSRSTGSATSRHFIEVWILTTNALRDGGRLPPDRRRLRRRGRVARRRLPRGDLQPGRARPHGSIWDEIFDGYCDGAAGGARAARRRGAADARHPARLHAEEARADGRATRRSTATAASSASGSAGSRRSSRRSRTRTRSRSRESLGLGSVPHAGEVAGAASVRGALEALGADRLRHGIRAVEDPGSSHELAGRGMVLDVCPLSNLRTGVVAVARRAPAAAARRRRRPLLDLDRRPGDVRHRPDARLRGGGRARRHRRAPRTRPASPARSATTRRASRLRQIGERPTTGAIVRVPADGDRERSGAGRVAPRGARGGPRPRGPARHLPQHAHHARRRGARPHPLPPGQDPRLVLHRPRQRGRRRRRRDGDGAGRRRHAAPPRHGRAHHARRRAVADLRAVHGPRRTARRTAATATSTWPTRSSG